MDIEIEIEQTFSGHNDWVNSIIFCASHNIIASSSQDCSIRLWGLKDGEKVKKFERNKKSVNQLANFTPDIFLSCSDDGTVFSWNVPKREFIKECFKQEVGILSVIRLGEDLFATGDQVGLIKVIKYSTGEVESSFADYSGWVCCMYRLITRPDIIISAGGGLNSKDDMMREFNFRKGEFIKKFDRGHLGQETALSSYINSENVERIVTGGTDRELLCWDIDTGKVFHRIKKITAVWSFLVYNNRFVFCGETAGFLRVFDIKSEEKIKDARAHKDTIRKMVGVSKDQIISCSNDKTIKVMKIVFKERLEVL